MKRNILTLVFLLSLSNLFGQSSNKIAPAFKYILSHPLNAETAANYPTLFNIPTVEGYDAQTGLYKPGYQCIIYTNNAAALRNRGIVVQAVLPRFVIAWVQLNQIVEIATMPEVSYVDAPKIIYPTNDISVGTSGASLLHNGKVNNTAYKGDGVIVGIFDTGIDWDHPDFRNPSDQTKSRILRIWDQTLTPIAGESSPTGFNYGVEYTQAHLNDELDGTPTGYVRERDYNGHGTHVTGTAAGNGAAVATQKFSGIAPNADIVVVKGGDNYFTYPSQINGMSYFQSVANALGKPMVINMSIGGQFGAHDATAPNEVAVDAFSNSAPGRVVVIAAGNDNGKALHKKVTITANASQTVSLNVPTPTGTSATDIFQIALYVNDTSTVYALLTAPNGDTLVANPGQDLVQNILTNTTTAYFTNEIDAESGDRIINLYIARKTTAINPSGTWTIKLSNATASTLTIDGWINYKGSDFGGITVAGADNSYQVHSPGTANSAITVASYLAKLDWYSTSTTAPGGYAFSNSQQDNISSFSSVGPRRDNVQKPEIAANGQAVVSCTSSNAGILNTSTSVVVNGLYHALSGTSMATPEVTGCVALLLQVKNTATYSEIRNAITTTATKDNFTTATINATWGSGKIDVFKAASSLVACKTFKRVTYSYDSSTTNTNNGSFSLASAKAATRFTPTITGKLGAVYFKTGTSIPTASFSVEVRTNNAGVPGTLLGSMSISPASIAKFSWNYYDISSLDITVTNATDYFIVLVPAATDSWNLGFESLSNSGRSFYSNGSSWTATNDLRIRSVVYDNTVPTSTSNNSISICSNLLPYSWNGLTFNTAGSQTAHLTNAAGCDSAATLNLSIKTISNSTTNITINAPQLPYSWNGLTLNAAGSQTARLTNTVGCDSAATLNLTVNTNITLAITGANAVCIGSTVTLNANIAGGVWTSLSDKATVSNAGVVTGGNPGTATIKYVVTDNGVVKTATYNLAVYAIPNVPSIVFAAGTTNPQAGAPTGGFCVGKVFNIVGVPAGGAWSANGSVSVTSLGQVTINSIGAGSIKYTYTNSNNCSNSRTMLGTGYICAARSANTVDSRQSTVDSDIFLYPNPAKNLVSLNLNWLVGSGKILVIDYLGKTIKTQALSLGINTIDIAGLSKGFYFISVITNQGNTTKKLIVE